MLIHFERTGLWSIIHVFVMDNALSRILFPLRISVIVSVPVMLAWGWVRWAKRKHPLTPSAVLSAAGFALASASALLAITTALYGQATGGFPFYDPRLLRIYRWGALLSLSGTALALSGLWRPSPLRWHAPVCTLGTLVFWLLTALGE
jgi:hypothetical protein